ncbi:putative lipid II flippase FtsW [Peptoniphilus sp. GNH]|nr:putative lipid II flippase FtsW [Peptoniphilus sp. GNH]
MKTLRKFSETLKNVDRGLLSATIILLLIGIMSVASASWPRGVIKHKGNGFYYTDKQIKAMILGLFAVIFILKVKMSLIKKVAFPAFVITILMIFALWIPGLSSEEYGQSRWLILRLGSRAIRLQPSDFLKISAIMYFAKYLEDKRKDIGKKEIFISILCFMGLCVAPVMTKDFSTALVIGVSLSAMFLVGGMKPYQFVVLTGLALGLVLFILFKDDAFRIKRILDFSSASSGDISNMDYHTKQSIFAIAMGGILGVGYFRSRQKYSYLPLAHNDFIFCIICEEFGLVGGAMTLGLFAYFTYRGLRISFDSQSLYEKYVGVGITSYIAIQAIFNMGVTTGIFPVTGITLPFISYGGTSLLSTLASTALLLRISANNKRRTMN